MDPPVRVLLKLPTSWTHQLECCLNYLTRLTSRKKKSKRRKNKSLSMNSLRLRLAASTIYRFANFHNCASSYLKWELLEAIVVNTGVVGDEHHSISVDSKTVPAAEANSVGDKTIAPKIFIRCSHFQYRCTCRIGQNGQTEVDSSYIANITKNKQWGTVPRTRDRFCSQTLLKHSNLHQNNQHKG